MNRYWIFGILVCVSIIIYLYLSTKPISTNISTELVLREPNIYKLPLSIADEQVILNAGNGMQLTKMPLPGYGCSVFSKELNKIIYIDMSKTPFIVYGNILEFSLGLEPIQKIGTVANSKRIFKQSVNREVVWSKGLKEFLCVIEGRPNVYKSSDGITWKEYKSSGNPYAKNLVWAHNMGIYVCISPHGNGYIKYSKNGYTWITTPFGYFSSTFQYIDSINSIIYMAYNIKEGDLYKEGETNGSLSINTLSFVNDKMILSNTIEDTFFSENRWPTESMVTFIDNETYLYFFDNISKPLKLNIFLFPIMIPTPDTYNYKPPNYMMQWNERENKFYITGFINNGKLIDDNWTITTLQSFSINKLKDIGISCMFSQLADTNSAIIKYVNL